MDISVRGEDVVVESDSRLKSFEQSYGDLLRASCSSAHDGKQSRNCCIVALTIKL